MFPERIGMQAVEVLMETETVEEAPQILEAEAIQALTQALSQTLQEMLAVPVSLLFGMRFRRTDGALC